MPGILPAVVEVTGSNLALVVVVAVIALGALAMAAMFRQQVLSAGEGTQNMQTIATAVQEGANAYLMRQFRYERTTMEYHGFDVESPVLHHLTLVKDAREV